MGMLRNGLVCFMMVAVGLPVLSQTVVKAEFDAVSIKSNKSGSGHSHVHGSNGGLRAENVSVKELLADAYDLPESQILAVPAGMEGERFDIEAKSDEQTNERIQKMPEAEADQLKQQMLQAMLADRFGLTAHRETRELPVYLLVTAKGGAKLAASKESGTHVSSSRRELTGKGMSMEDLASELARVVERVVIDKTGATGRYDIGLKWTPGSEAADAAADAPPTIFTAMQEQLGLKLEAGKGPVPVLVVDRVSLPTAN